ncbi:MAG TPA: hypothetical protein DHW63_03375 [Hyphomonadaceae bacterium]|nr:hypothetical protein [Hyphomonadaceae bacterium]
MALRQTQTKDGALVCACRRCGSANALFLAHVPPPVIGAFAFRCVECGADNAVSAHELKRVAAKRPDLIEAA